MTPAEIARRAHADPDRLPLDSIMDALGLDDIPTVASHGPEVVRRWTETLDAYKAETREDRHGTRLSLVSVWRHFHRQDATQREYARRCGVGADTACRWLRDAGFRFHQGPIGKRPSRVIEGPCPACGEIVEASEMVDENGCRACAANERKVA